MTGIDTGTFRKFSFKHASLYRTSLSPQLPPPRSQTKAFFGFINKIDLDWGQTHHIPLIKTATISDQARNTDLRLLNRE